MIGTYCDLLYKLWPQKKISSLSLPCLTMVYNSSGIHLYYTIHHGINSHQLMTRAGPDLVQIVVIYGIAIWQITS